MSMYNPCHPGEILKKDIMAPLHLSVSEAATHLGVSRKTLSKIINGKGKITPEMALRLEMAFSPSAESWLRMQAAFDLWQARHTMPEFHIEPIAHATS
ncbi:MAG: HigA family addiction module antitoxin [Dissulfuribacterales bacterium]